MFPEGWGPYQVTMFVEGWVEREIRTERWLLQPMRVPDRIYAEAPFQWLVGAA
jgi:hypothetical protein